MNEWLTKATHLPITMSKKEAERLRKERARKAAAILPDCDRAAAAFTRRTDSAETIRRMRDEGAPSDTIDIIGFKNLVTHCH
jgi:hypothetical protein